MSSGVDPRDNYRAFLRALRSHDRRAFDEAVAAYEALAERIAAGAEPRPEWLRYGMLLAASAGGRAVAIDADGRAIDWDGAERASASVTSPQLVLHLPDSRAVPPLALIVPDEPSDAQQATLDLLVEGRTTLR